MYLTNLNPLLSIATIKLSYNTLLSIYSLTFVFNKIVLYITYYSCL